MKQWIAFLLVATLTGGCQKDVAPKPASRDEDLGRKVYNFRCYFCHGYGGDAKTLAATYMTPPPRSFIGATPGELPKARILDALQHGRPGTGMKSFVGTIPQNEIDAVADFVYAEFVVKKAENTRYHTDANGWANHERYRAAYPFVLGEIALAAPSESLTAEQRAGWRLFMESCVSCHDRGPQSDGAATWDAQAVSFPRNNYDHRKPEVDAVTSATLYHVHDVRPAIANLAPQERLGEQIFQDNCAFCHAADGTGKNWIGSFLEPHPRNLTDPTFMGKVNRPHLRGVIRNGLPDTSMPAWKAVLSDTEIEAVIAYISRAFHPVAE